MKQIATYTIVGIILAGAALVHTGWAEDADPAPKITCAEPKFDFGSKDNSGVVTHDYVVKNEGDADLLISNVKASCGCTVAEISSKHLEPGQEATITARFDLKGRRGKQSKNITVTSNDPVNPKFKLYLTGTATSEIDVNPKMLSFGNVLPGEETTKTITVKSNTDRDFTIKEVKALSSKVNCRVEEVEAGREYTIHCTLPGDQPIGRVSDRIKITTDHPKLPSLDVTVTGKVVGKLVVSPDRISLSENTDRPVTRYITVSAGSVKEFEVLEATWPDDTVEVKTTKMPRLGYRVQLRNVLGRMELNGKELVLKTNVEGMEELKVPISVRPKSPRSHNHSSTPPQTTDAPPGSTTTLVSP